MNKRRISLYIANRLVDLDDDPRILFNYAQNELSNPTIVKNSFSQQISLPKTAANNAIFGHIGRTDRYTISTSFNVLRRTPFVIYNEMNEVIESGYVKVESVDGDAYHVSLYGGLGGFFYFLSFNDQGNKKTLADMSYKYDGVTAFSASSLIMAINKTNVKAAWDSLASNGTGVWSLVNFAPCSNGFPSCKFDANKAAYKEGSTAAEKIPDLFTSRNGYTGKSGDTIILEFGEKHTDVQMQDYRTYLQRPVISLKRLLQSFTLSQNTGDYTFVIDSSVTDSSNKWYNEGWMTLKMFDRDNLNPSSFTFADLLSKTATPADYLIGFAKMFGLVFSYDGVTKTITMMKRDKYYDTSALVDLTRLIDQNKGITMIPFAMDSKYYVWDADTYGLRAKVYEEQTGQKFGSQWVNTNYDFSSDKKHVLEGMVYKGGQDVRETDPYFFVVPYERNTDKTPKNYIIKFKLLEEVTWKMYKTTSEAIEEQEFKPLDIVATPVSDTGQYQFGYFGDYQDWMQRLQVHGENNKAEEGDNVLLFFNGMVDNPQKWETIQGTDVYWRIPCHLSDDSQAMLDCNNGVPCWDVSVVGSNILAITRMPSFARVSGQYSFDFGAYGLKDIYSSFWQKYIADRYDVDTQIMRCNVDFTGIQVSQQLLRGFYWYGGAYWVLNKISNHSLTTYDSTECEFVKVQDMNNYNNGQ